MDGPFDRCWYVQSAPFLQCAGCGRPRPERPTSRAMQADRAWAGVSFRSRSSTKARWPTARSRSRSRRRGRGRSPSRRQPRQLLVQTLSCRLPAVLSWSLRSSGASIHAPATTHARAPPVHACSPAGPCAQWYAHSQRVLQRGAPRKDPILLGALTQQPHHGTAQQPRDGMRCDAMSRADG